MQISIIAALTDDLLIGADNQMIWHLPSDLKHFKTLTLGKPILMGRKTYEAIGRPLPERRNVIISRQKDLQYEGCEVYDSLDKALGAVKDAPEIMIIGGGEIYKQALPKANTMYLTYVHHDFTGDTYFPEWDDEKWQEVERQDFDPDDKNRYSYSFVTLKHNP